MRLGPLIQQEFVVPVDYESILSSIEIAVGDDEFDLLIAEGGDRASVFLGTTKIQKKSTKSGDIATLGFDSLIGALSSLDPEEKIGVGSLSGRFWVGRLNFRKNGTNNQLLGLVLVKRRVAPSLKTPPNWDGSRKSLEEYNRDGAGS